MTTYLFLEQLFKNVLAESGVMQGRLCICPQYGQEMNSDTLNAVIKEAFSIASAWKWPGVLMMPPVSEMTLKDNTGEWERYRIELYFLTTTFYTGANQIKVIDKDTQTSTHRIVEDWHDMKRCAKDFVLMLTRLVAEHLPDQLRFRIPGSEKKYFDPLSLQGTNRLSGVRLTFKADLWTGCEIEDYQPGSCGRITIPDHHSHPSHSH